MCELDGWPQSFLAGRDTCRDSADEVVIGSESKASTSSQLCRYRTDGESDGSTLSFRLTGSSSFSVGR